jgi:hypothetical protein
MSQILQEQGAVAADVSTQLEALVEKHLALHGNDVSKSLAAISAIGHEVLAELKRISDSEVQQSLAKAGTDDGLEFPSPFSKF